MSMDEKDSTASTAHSSGPSVPVARSVMSVATPIGPDGWPTVPRVVDSDYKRLYVSPHKKGSDEFLYVHLHMSGVGVLGLAPSHPVVAEKKDITSLKFLQGMKDGGSGDPKAVQVSGKRKRGAPQYVPACSIQLFGMSFSFFPSLYLFSPSSHPMHFSHLSTVSSLNSVHPGTGICQITCADGSFYVVKCPMTGKLVEVNEAIVVDPNSIHKDPDFAGFIGLVVITHKEIDNLLKSLLSPSAYETMLLKSSNSSSISISTSTSTSTSSSSTLSVASDEAPTAIAVSGGSSSVMGENDPKTGT